MFEAVGENWKTYLSAASATWQADDARHNLGGEVRGRLRRLDLIIRQLQAAREAMFDPAEVKCIAVWGIANQPRLERGEITIEEFIEGTSPSPPRYDPIEYWDTIWNLTECFHFSAWRMVGILNNGKDKKNKVVKDPYLAGLAFPGLDWIEARDVRIIRNNLIEHPEDKGSRNYLQSLTFTDDGPVLRSSAAIVRGSAGRTEPTEDSKDRGLFVAAESLRDELQQRISKAIETASSAS